MGSPESWVDVFLLPGILVFLGAIIWIGSWLGDQDKPKANPWRWIAVIPLLFALVIGIQNLWAMHNPETGRFYLETMRAGTRLSRRLLVAHYLTFILPLVSLIVIIIWNKVDRDRRSALEDY